MDDVIRSTARGRRTILTCLTLLFLALAAASVWLRPLLDMPPDLPREQAVERALGIVRLISAFAVVTSVAGGAYGGWLARQLLRQGQFPLPGTLVLHDTKVQRGTRVRLRAYALLGLSLMLFALAALASRIPASLAAEFRP